MEYNSLANEFQLINPRNIQNHATPGGSGSVGTGDMYWVKPTGNLAISNDDNVIIEYYSNKPNESDWIGAYSPAGANHSEVVPVRFAMADVSPAYLSSGFGSLTFNFTNLREDISFYIFSNGLKTPFYQNSSLNAAPDSQTVSFTNPNQPLRPRVVATGDYNEYKVLWSSNNSVTPQLKWGVSPNNYPNVVNAVTSRIERSDVCGGHAQTDGWRDQGSIHTAVMTGMKALQPGSFIYYQFGDKNTSDFSGMNNFTVPPQPGQQPPDRPTTAILYCDLGRGSLDDSETWNDYGRPAINTTMSAGALIRTGAVDVVFHGGDISYACGYEAVWDFFLNMLAPIASRVLYLTTVGNHESDWPGTSTIYNQMDSGGECGVLATKLIPMPSPATTNQPWWSYDVGLIHFVGMSTEHDFTSCSPQYNFLEEDLASVNRTKTPWVIFNGHRAMYINSDFTDPTKSYSDGVVMDQLIANIEPILWKYKVNAAFWGHNHVFQRQSAVLQKVVVQTSEERTNTDGDVQNWYENPQATVQIVIGNAGASFSNNSINPWPVWNEQTSNFFGYSIVKAHNATHLTWDTLDSNTASGTEVRDRVVITQTVGADAFVLPDASPYNTMDTSTANCNVEVQKNNTLGGLMQEYYYVVIVVVLAILCAVGLLWYYRLSKSRPEEEDSKDDTDTYSGGALNPLQVNATGVVGTKN